MNANLDVCYNIFRFTRYLFGMLCATVKAQICMKHPGDGMLMHDLRASAGLPATSYP